VPPVVVLLVLLSILTVFMKFVLEIWALYVPVSCALLHPVIAKEARGRPTPSISKPLRVYVSLDSFIESLLPVCK
jgi:hypothetical protein